jgi:hypothetical protein
MLFPINNQLEKFIPIKEFRAAHELPTEFGVSLFTPKDYTDLGKIDGASAQLADVRRAVLAAVPTHQPVEGWLGCALALQMCFRRSLQSVNTKIGLRTSEIDFAASGFGDVCQAYVYETLSARMRATSPPDIAAVHMRWLQSSVRVLVPVFIYPFQQGRWMVKLLKHAYGRMGLIIDTAETVHYVYDSELSCPAAGFMASLLGDVGERLLRAMLDASFDAGQVQHSSFL